ncbi:MAG: hypothetical protein PHO02_07225, partial [Candidatus Nanoarchaeia archaeon]|nr:hypothetical protein [Candidatus Nanoarchaeia archaeon]
NPFVFSLKNSRLMSSFFINTTKIQQKPLNLKGGDICHYTIHYWAFLVKMDRKKEKKRKKKS